MAKYVVKKEQSATLQGKVFNSLASDSTTDAASIYAMRNAFSNPNLLINGDSRVNQREKSHYTTTREYTVDRWMIRSAQTTVGVNDDGTITLNKLGADNAILTQYADYNNLPNQFYSLSAMVDGKVISGKVQLTNVIYLYSGDLPKAYEDDDFVLAFGYLVNNKAPMFQIHSKKGSSIIGWRKLEIGEIATPFVPRSYAEELMLCKRYYQVGETEGPVLYEYTGNVYMCSFSYDEMRVNPTGQQVSYVFYSQAGDSIAGVMSDTRTISKTRIRFITAQSSSPIQSKGCGVVIAYKLDAEIY